VTTTTFGSKTFICINAEKQSINMKKILYSVFMLATMVLAACSSDDTTEPAVKRGMVLKANVEDTDTRATITDNEGKWKFAFAEGDVVKVGNDKVTGYYTFTNDGTMFTSTDAKQTAEAANWCAFFPGETIDLRNQSGDFADVANRYALAGATATPTTGSDGLTVTMKAKAAVLCIVGVKDGDCLDINVQTAEGYVSGLTAAKNSAGFKVQTSPAKVTLLSKQKAGVYYVVVPADVKLSVYNDNTLIKATKAGGLTAGKYYTLKTGDVDGEEDATIDGVVVKKKWVQLWPGGPKFATENVASKMTWKGATKTDAEYVWGANWRTPTKDEMTFVSEHTLTPINTKAEIQVQNGVIGILFTGIKPGYTDKTLFLSGENVGGYYHAGYWTSTVINLNSATL
jgi:major membrane immunogen (membrane-anchored lipoprotein)